MASVVKATENAGPEGVCPFGSFSPIRSTPITDYLRQSVGLAPGRPFHGIVATFTGVQGKESVSWFDHHAIDGTLWRNTGNDHRSVGLWHFDIPTLHQYNNYVTPTYYLLLNEFLARPSDKQIRSVMVMSRPHEPMLKLWGVRFLIADYDLPFGVERLRMAVPDLEPLRLFELTDSNRGNYSPTEVVRVENFRQALDILRGPGFDGRRTVVTDVDLGNGLVGAGDAVLTVEKDALRIRAFSAGRSVLVLPAQYSHCWTIHGSGDPMLFRADILQLGVRFSGALDARLQLVLGPFGASGCRVDDSSDMERLRIRTAVTDCLQQRRHFFGWCAEPGRQILHRRIMMDRHSSEYDTAGWLDFLHKLSKAAEMINHKVPNTVFFLCRSRRSSNAGR